MSNKYIVEVWLNKDGWHKKQNDLGKWTHPGRPETITVGPHGGITIEGSPSKNHEEQLRCRINIFRNCWVAATNHLNSYQ